MGIHRLYDYVEALKPRQTSLLTFVGVCAAFIASEGNPSFKPLLIGLTILVASAGATGLTNYLDRDVDAKMRRTRDRALPSKRIYPPEKVLPAVIGLIVVGLVFAFYLHWLSFLADLLGTVSAAFWRKRWTCVFPQGIMPSCAPVLMGWFAIKPAFSWELLLLCLLIIVWLPLHVWSVMIANREDYIGAGLDYFPMSWQPKDAAKVLLAFGLVLYAASIGLYFVGGFTQLYLVVASLLGAMMVYGASRLVISGISRDAWRLYKLSAFPYLGIVFLTMSLDRWLLA
jgi:protoheme IX farnesyltransferase